MYRDLVKVYLQFVPWPRAAGRKTEVWDVRGVANGVLLGQVRWYAPWRRYAFMPKSETIYDAACMFELSTFCARQMELRREQRRVANTCSTKTIEL